MVSREQLRVHGLRAYEIGRWRAASRVGLVLVPVCALCLFESRGRAACAGLAALLLGLAIWLRWRDRAGFESVTTGLQAGSLPLVAGIVLDRLDLHCGLGGDASLCTGLALLLGGAGGAFIGLRETQWRARFWSWLAAGVVAVLAASLGCLRLGVLGVASVLVGVALGVAVTARVARQP
jgi:hypothetical protein